MQRLFVVVDINIVFINEQKQWLFMLRQNTGFKDGEYAFVAGHLEARESLKQCAVREAKEEVGAEIAEEDLELVHLMRRESDSARMSVFFLCKRWKGKIQNMEPEKCGGLCWCEENEFPTPTVDHIIQAMQAIKQGELVSDFP